MPSSDLDAMAREMAEVLIKMRHDLTDQPTPEYSSATNYNAEYLTLGLKSFARKYAALRLREAGAGMPDMDTFMARLSCHPKCVTIHDHYQHGFDGSGDQWPQLEGLWGDCSNQWETMIRRMADEEESNE